MARKSGGFNKILNFIGLVDDEDTNDTYGEEYQSGNYGRQQPYVPAANRQRPAAGGRQTASQQSRRTLPPPQRTQSRYDDRQAARPSAGRSLSAYDSRQARASRSYGEYDQDRSANRRTGGSRFADEVPAYDYSPRAAGANRFNDEQPAGQLQQRQAPQRGARSGGRTRTVMFSLRTLEDCCAVIDELIANNTVVLTMDEMDGHLMQRAVDTLSGAVFALSANIRKASDKTYLITPMSVEVNEAYDVERRF